MNDFLLKIQPYLDMLEQQLGMKTSGQCLQFASAEDRFSTSLFAVAAAGVLSTQSQPVFKANKGDAGGQGFTVAYTAGLTNNETGTQMPQNQLYVGTKMGFQFFQANGTDPSAAAFQLTNFSRSQDLAAVASMMQVSYKSGGLVERILGRLIDYPQDNGVFAVGVAPQITGYGTALTTIPAAGQPIVSEFGVQNGSPYKSVRELDIPILFQPLVNVDMKMLVQNNLTLSDSQAAVVPSATVAGAFIGTWRGASQFVVTCGLQGFNSTIVPRQA